MDQHHAPPGLASVAPTGAAGSSTAEPLRVRRRRELRQHISDVATRMFFEQGFDAVRVADIASASGITEKTVFNHFPTKQSLLADRWELRITDARRVLADPHTAPVAAMVNMIKEDLAVLIAPPWPTLLGSHLADMERYSDLIHDTPSLRTHQREQLNALTVAVADALAERDQCSAVTGSNPERWITATAVVGLWSVYTRSLHRAVQTQRAGDLNTLRISVTEDVVRAGDVLTRGL